MGLAGIGDSEGQALPGAAGSSALVVPGVKQAENLAGEAREDATASSGRDDGRWNPARTSRTRRPLETRTGARVAGHSAGRRLEVELLGDDLRSPSAECRENRSQERPGLKSRSSTTRVLRRAVPDRARAARLSYLAGALVRTMLPRSRAAASCHRLAHHGKLESSGTRPPPARARPGAA